MRETLMLLHRLAKAFPAQTIPAASLEVYAEELASIPPAEFAHVTKAAARRGRFFPSIGELLEIRDELHRTGIRPSDHDAAERLEAHRRFLAEPPPELRALVDGVARAMTPEPRRIGGAHGR